MQPWPACTPVLVCKNCDQPIAILPALIGKGDWLIWPLWAVLYLFLLPLMGGAITAFVMRIGSIYWISVTLTFCALAFGMMWFWEGTANMKTRRKREYNVPRQHQWHRFEVVI